jgi:nifR3 family TIM-barrel protein
MLSIGSVRLDAPIVQAALSGYSDAGMRRLAREYGCPYTMNEVVLDKSVAQGGKKVRRLLAPCEEDHPIGGQLMGSEPGQFAEAADVLVSLGYDAIDVNFACPVKKVLSRERGGFLLSVPQKAQEILRRVYDAVDGRVAVTVKMRRGLDDTPGSERDFYTILDAAFEIGAAAVTVHGRTVAQRYAGPSDWSFLAKVKRHVGHRIILGSGDLFSAEACVRMLDQTGVDGCSIARGAIGNPFVFREVRALLAGERLGPPPSIRQQRRAVERHFGLMCERYGERNGRRLFRKFGVRYSELHPCRREVKVAFVAVRTAEDWRSLLGTWYGEASAYPPVVRHVRPEVLIAAGAKLAEAEEAT